MRHIQLFFIQAVKYDFYLTALKILIHKQPAEQIAAPSQDTENQTAPVKCILSVIGHILLHSLVFPDAGIAGTGADLVF